MKLAQTVIVPRDSTVGLDRIVDRVLIVGRAPIVDLDLKVLQVIVPRDLKVQRQVIVRRDSTVGRVPIVDLDLKGVDRDLKDVDLDPKGVGLDLKGVDRVPREEGRRKHERRTLEQAFRKPNPRHRNKQRNRLQSRQLCRRRPLS